MTSRVMKQELTPLQTVVLGFVVQRPSYGYEIARHLRHGVCGLFLKLYKSAVYGVLERFEELGFVVAVDRDAEEEQITTRGRDRRCFYQATPEGERAYERQVIGELGREAERAEILARVLSAARLGTPALRKIVDECEKLCEEREQALAAVQTLDALDPGVEALCERLVLAERTIELAGLREWIALSRDAIDAYEQEHCSQNGASGRTRRQLRRNASSPRYETTSVESRVMADV